MDEYPDYVALFVCDTRNQFLRVFFVIHAFGVSYYDWFGATMEHNLPISVAVKTRDFFAEFLRYEAFVDYAGGNAVGANERLEFSVQKPHPRPSDRNCREATDISFFCQNLKTRADPQNELAQLCHLHNFAGNFGVDALGLDQTAAWNDKHVQNLRCRLAVDLRIGGYYVGWKVSEVFKAWKCTWKIN